MTNKKMTQKELSALLRKKVRAAGLKLRVTTCDWLTNTTDIDPPNVCRYFTKEEISKLEEIIKGIPELEAMSLGGKDIDKVSHLSVSRNLKYCKASRV